MAELTDKTVQELTKMLQRLERSTASKGPGADSGREFGQESAEDILKRAEAEKQYSRNRKERADIDEAASRSVLDLKRKERDALDEVGTEYARLQKEIDGLEKQYTKVSKVQKKLHKQVEQGEAAFEMLADDVLAVGGAFSGLAKRIPLSIGAMAGFAKALVSPKKLLGLVSGLLMKVVSNSIEFALAVDKAAASFRSATGAGYKYSRVISRAGLAYHTYGIKAADAGAATNSLFGSFRDFTDLSEGAQTRLVQTTAILGKFGVSSDETAQNMNTMTKSLGMSWQQGERTLREFEAIARSVGKPISEISKDFQSAVPKIAFYGAQAINVFKQLEAQSKSTGLSVDQLLGVFGEQFDTFEGSAKAVGKLNALLGGPYLNSIDMLNASEDERLQMMKEGIEASGIIFSDLNKFEQKAIASAMGTDVDTLRKALTELSPYEEAQVLRQEQLARKAGQARDILTKLTDAFNSLIVVNQPFIDQLVTLVDQFSDWIQKNHDISKVLNKDVIPAIKDFGTYLKDTVWPFLKNKLKPTLVWIKDHWKAIALVWVGFKAAGLVYQLGLITGALWANAAAGQAATMSRMGAMGAMGVGAIGVAGLVGSGMYSNKLYREGNKAGSAAMSIGGMAASGALIGSVIPGVGTLIGAGVGAGIGAIAGAGWYASQGDRMNDGILVKTGNKVQSREINSSDKAKIIVGTPGGPVDRGTDVFSPSAAGGTSDQATLMRENVTAPLIKALREMNLTADVKIEGEMGKLLDVVNSPQGKTKYMPFYNR